MYSFRNDYSEGAHPRLLQALAETNLEQTPGYGLDPYCQKAAGTIRRLCEAPDADVHFLVGGTQTNLTAVASLLRPYEGVIAAATGHVNVHETGAIEATGHKVLSVPTPDGKLTPELAESAAGDRQEHMVYPGMVYVSHTTELGTVYTKAELTALRRYCDRHGMLLFLDGARLGSGLASPESDLTLPDIAALTDAFYIGGTKNGALFGEALVFASPNRHFRWHLKQRGAMFAKGRLLGIQFQTLLEDGLYLDLARHANECAFRLRDGIARLGCPFLVHSPSNQQFPILPNTAADRLRELGYAFEVQQAMDEDHTCIRLVTSWATPEEAVTAFLRDLGTC